MHLCSTSLAQQKATKPQATCYDKRLWPFLWILTQFRVKKSAVNKVQRLFIQLLGKMSFIFRFLFFKQMHFLSFLFSCFDFDMMLAFLELTFPLFSVLF